MEDRLEPVELMEEEEETELAEPFLKSMLVLGDKEIKRACTDMTVSQVNNQKGNIRILKFFIIIFFTLYKVV